MPTGFDLRRCGWLLDDGQEPDTDCVSMIDTQGLDSVAWMKVLAAYSPEVRRFIVVTGIRRAHERATLLQIGFGDAVSDEIDIEELGARVGRTVETTHWLPRQRRFGALELDLLAREAYGHGRPVNLNPREFALLWRLADNPNEAVSKETLIQDVWRMGFVPETNSIAVHMSRLRRKLAFAGLEGIIETASQGGYRLQIANGRDAPLTSMPATMRVSRPAAGRTSGNGRAEPSLSVDLKSQRGLRVY
ncbi:winged helix-turn-helix domain-containing protein [Novosphingobium mangrovi (ex Huang et al. 2023)]|uniref:Response regulator transcription factor n=1 Tax=Novosphingobium mangrovi (ex Huang et al. 2023) TaxID=2976432 RepID=A0ABT2I042_9SPHN|nr:response regulator transcription factor [Novosphingobium mangrovi (ex Huang et al. 2023)]MCT2397992.1 response regulator transcription factor [Novosphingobium mangrovi (ex Huang et al. 2023)]